MGLQIIGAGIGRTGTESLKLALETLGFDSCYHMSELFNHPDGIREWEKMERGETVDYQTLFAGFEAGVDLPVALYYKILMEEFPKAKVILTLRDPDKWYESASKTIFKPISNWLIYGLRMIGLFSNKHYFIAKILSFVKRVGHEGLFDNRMKDKEACKIIFNQWNKNVIEFVPPERLLIFDVKHGWKPLCAFLEVPVPDCPFPHANRKEDFKKSTSVPKLFK